MYSPVASRQELSHSRAGRTRSHVTKTRVTPALYGRLGVPCCSRKPQRRLASMSRRLTFLALVLVALSGIVPAWACAAVAQTHDCCPDRKPCDQPEVRTDASDQVACCASAASQSQVVVARVQKNESLDSSPGDDLFVVHSAAPLERAHLSQAPPLARAQTILLGRDRLLYLQTGRLRL
jgi:hypothetical protein